MLRLEITYGDGRSEIVDFPSSHTFCDLRVRFGASSVEVLQYVP